jgi:hypothetical protein
MNLMLWMYPFSFVFSYSQLRHLLSHYQRSRWTCF